MKTSSAGELSIRWWISLFRWCSSMVVAFTGFTSRIHIINQIIRHLTRKTGGGGGSVPDSSTSSIALINLGHNAAYGSEDFGSLPIALPTNASTFRGVESRWVKELEGWSRMTVLGTTRCCKGRLESVEGRIWRQQDWRLKHWSQGLTEVYWAMPTNVSPRYRSIYFITLFIYRTYMSLTFELDIR